MSEQETTELAAEVFGQTADAWKERALSAEAKVAELEELLAREKRDRAKESRHTMKRLDLYQELAIGVRRWLDGEHTPHDEIRARYRVRKALDAIEGR